MDTWDPRKDDYDDPYFNSYIKGPGRYLGGGAPKAKAYTKEGMKHVQLFLQGIPKEMTEDGLEGLFSRAGNVKRVKIMQSKKEHAGDTFGFVTMENLIAAERAISLFDGFIIGDFSLSVSVSKSREELDRIKRQREMNASMMAAQSTYGDFSDSEKEFDFTAQHDQPGKVNGVKLLDQTVPTGALGKGRGKKLLEIAGVSPRGDADLTLTSRSRLNSLSIDVTTDNSRHSRSQEHYSHRHGRGDFSYSGGRGRGQEYNNYSRGRGQGNYNHGYGRGYYSNRGRGAYQNYFPGYGGYQPIMPMPVIMQPYTMPPMYDPPVQEPTQTISSVTTPPVRQECSVCQKLGYSRCSRCKLPYCSQKCQTEDWPAHKLTCGKTGKNKNTEEMDFEKTLEGFDVGVGNDFIPKVKALMEKATGDKFDIKRKAASKASSVSSSLTSDDDKPMKKNNKPNTTRTDDSANRNRNSENRENRDRNNDNRDRNKDNRERNSDNYTDRNRTGGRRGQENDRGQDDRDNRRNNDQRRGGNDGNRTRSAGMPDERGCFNCGDKTHMKNECPKGSKAVCYNCQEAGHMSRECPKKSGTGNTTSSGGWGNKGRNINRDDENTTKSSSIPVMSSTPKDEKKSPPKKNLPTVSLPLNEEMSVVICEVRDPCYFYLQINHQKYSQPFQTLMMDLQKMYGSCAPDVTSVMVNEVYCVQFSLDKNWYRGKVLKASGNTVSVQFLDFGNIEDTSMDCMRYLAENFTNLPCQGVLCALDGVLPKFDNWKISGSDLARYLPTDQGMTATCVRITDTADGKLHHLIITNNGENVAKQLIEADMVLGLKSQKPETPITKPAQPKQDVVKSENRSEVMLFKDMKKAIDTVTVGGEFTFVIANVTSPITFSIQIVESSLVEQFVAFTAKFNEEYNVCADTEYRPKVVGELVASLFSQDQGWYRARVLELVDTGAVVEFIDYLNSEKVTFNMMRQASPTFMEFPAQGVLCTYHGLVEPAGGQWPEDLIVLFSELSQRPLNGTVKSMVGDKLSIEISISGVSVTEPIQEIMAQVSGASQLPAEGSESTLVNKDVSKVKVKTESPGAAAVNGTKQDKIPAGDLPMDGSKLKVLVTCVSAIDSVYVQDLDPSIDKRLNEMMLDLNQTVQVDKSYKPCEGDCVAVVFTVSGVPLWHRGHITAKVSEDSFMVILIDYGNAVCVKLEDLAPLDSKFLTPPAFAVRCQLAGTEKFESSDLLMELQTLADHEVFVQAVNYEKEIFFIVVTRVDGTNVNEAIQCYATESAAAQKSPAVKVSCQPAGICNVSEPNYAVILPYTELSMGSADNKVKIVYIENIAKFFVHLCDNEKDVKLLECLKDMQLAYKDDESVYAANENEYVAVYFDDGSGAVWYRGQILKINNDETVTVAIIDYGNEGVVPTINIRRLKREFASLPIAACECRLVGSTGKEDKDMVDQFRCLETDCDDIDVQVLAKNGNTYLVDIVMRDAHKTKVSEFLELDTSVTQSLISEESEQTVPQVITTPPPNKTDVNSSPVSQPVVTPTKTGVTPSKTVECRIEDSRLPLNTEISAVTYVVESIKSFYVQMADEETQKLLATIMVQLAEYCTGIDEGYTPSVGEVIAALFVDGEDITWYRGQVMEVVDEKSAKVFFLDYGNTEAVLFKDIRKLEARFLTTPKMAIHCRLSGSGVETAEMLQKFQTMSNVPMTICARSLCNGLYEVDVIMPDGKTLSADLGLIPDVPSEQNSNQSTSTEIVDNLPKQMSPKAECLPKKTSSSPKAEKKIVFTQTLKKSRPEGDSFKGIISSIVNPSDFHCQIFPEGEQNIILHQELKFLSDTMMLECDEDNTVCEQTFEVGQLCCAKFPEDNCWYRASVLEIFPDQTVKVEYVDFGNTADIPVSLLRHVTMDYTRLPLLAFKCSLSGVQPAEFSWTDDAILELKKFQDVKLDAKVVSVDKDVYIVELTDETRNVVVAEHFISAGLAKAAGETEEISEMERIRRENEVLRRQMEALQAKFASAK